MNELIPLILIALICLVIGFLLGLLVSGLRAEKGSSRVHAETRKPRIQESPNGVQIAAVQQAAAPKAAPQPLSGPHPEPAPPGTPGLPVHPEMERPSSNLVSRLVHTRQPAVPPQPGAPMSIAAQIDEILQERLVSCSLDHLPIEKRAIRLIELPGKGLVVMVGLEQYEGVEKVPDHEIRSLIHEAVEVWEKRLANG